MYEKDPLGCLHPKSGKELMRIRLINYIVNLLPMKTVIAHRIINNTVYVSFSNIRNTVDNFMLRHPLKLG
ncbi:hypothetical protein D3C73_1365430 [compost metagenome]